MNKAALIAVVGLAGAAWNAPALADEVGRVISSTPVIQQVPVQRQVCTQQPVAVQQPSSGGGGALVGAIVGGLLGNTIGDGSGRGVATGVGMIAGAMVGDRVDQGIQPPQYGYAPQCTTQTYYENRTVGYNVEYEYAGKQYQVQMPYDPGPTVRVQVTPVSSVESGQPVVTQAPQGVILTDSPVVYTAPAPYTTYASPYYVRPPVSLSLGFGYVGGGHHHHGHRHRH